MKWADTIAARCRYGDAAETVYGAMEVLAERSTNDYQGHASVLLWDGANVHYIEWDYGSCGGCDAWEAAGLTSEQVAAAIRDAAIVMTPHEAGLWAAALRADAHAEYARVLVEDGNAVRAALATIEVRAGAPLAPPALDEVGASTFSAIVRPR